MSEQRGDLPPGTILGMILNENARLRAELAAELARAVAVTKQGEALVFMAVTDAVERCAKIAEDWVEKLKARDSVDETHIFGIGVAVRIAAAIRASNTARVDVQQSDPSEDTHQWVARMHRQSEGSAPSQQLSQHEIERLSFEVRNYVADFEDADRIIALCFETFAARSQAVDRASNAAPPHVEPSAAESEADDRDVMRIWRECGLPEYFLGNGGTNHKLVAFAARFRNPATEARMVELARMALNRNCDPEEATELAALVIETFGEKK